jgi:hypothetical protein
VHDASLHVEEDMQLSDMSMIELVYVANMLAM